jgi:hypothetical protein
MADGGGDNSDGAKGTSWFGVGTDTIEGLGGPSTSIVHSDEVEVEA